MNERKRKPVNCYSVILVLTFPILIVAGMLAHDLYLVSEYRNYDSYSKVMWQLTRANYKERMLKEFDRPYNFTELLDWVDEKLEWIPENDHLENRWFEPFEILDAGKGRCGEHTHLYVAACIAHGYEARIVRSFITDDHVWAEVKINDEWIHVEVVDKYLGTPYQRYESGVNVTTVIAYSPFSYENVTSNYVRTKSGR